jgi:tRNA-2-methylthio-N6-dimethylallyladenosine synthase
MKIYLETFGCQMNRLDSELVMGRLRSAGHEFVDDQKHADVVLLNTCSVRDHAEQKVHSRLGNEGKRSRSGKKRIVAVLGCMAQREGQDLLQRYPHVDIVCAPGQLHRLATLIAEAGGNGSTAALDPDRKSPRDIQAETGMDRLDLSRDPDLIPAPAQAQVRVMRGCDKFCSYCIVPFVRGPERSRNPGDIVQEVRKLLDAGRTEITLLGQTVNSYRYEAGETHVSFSDLLEKLSPLPGLRRLRFVTSYPTDFGDDILHAMADLPNVCPYIHCPAQSGSDAILKRMNRRYSRAEYDDLVDRARAIVPDLALAGDFIVGFPGEREEDHQASADLIRRSGYKNSFIFKYSPRPDTRAASRQDDVPEEVKKRRNNELLDVQKQVGLEHHRSWIGREVEVLVHGPSRMADKNAPDDPSLTQLQGRTVQDHIVVFDGPESWTGSYRSVRITDATSLTLFAQVQKTES